MSFEKVFLKFSGFSGKESVVKCHFCKYPGKQPAHFQILSSTANLFLGILWVFLEQLFLKAFMEDCLKNNILAPGT